VFARGLQVLSQRQDIRALRCEILHRGEHFLARFAQAQHEACFRGHLGARNFARRRSSSERS